MPRSRSLLRWLFTPAISRGRAFARDDKGAVAVEFAILALPFFTIIFAIIETAMAFFAQQVLESAVQEASRSVQTGQAAGWDLQDFRDAMCPKLLGLLDCNDDNKLRIIVKVVSNFTSADVDPPIGSSCTPGAPPANCDWAITSAFDGGTGKQVLMVQAYYKWPVIVNLPWFSMATQAGDTRLLSGIRVFQNEPF